MYKLKIKYLEKFFKIPLDFFFRYVIIADVLARVLV